MSPFLWRWGRLCITHDRATKLFGGWRRLLGPVWWLADPPEPTRTLILCAKCAEPLDELPNAGSMDPSTWTDVTDPDMGPRSGDIVTSENIANCLDCGRRIPAPDYGKPQCVACLMKKAREKREAK